MSTELDELHSRFTDAGIARQQRQHSWTRLKEVALKRYDPDYKRAGDALLAGTLLLTSLPLFVVLRLGFGPVRRTTRVGRWNQHFEELSFEIPKTSRLYPLQLNHLPALLNVLKGEMSFVGPRAAAPGEFNVRRRSERRRYEVRPGLISLWWLRERTNIGFDGEALTDAEYIASSSIRSDLGIAARAAVAALYGKSGEDTSLAQVRVFDLPVDNLTMDEAMAWIITRLFDPEPGTVQLSFLNADCCNIAYKHVPYQKFLRYRSDLTLADGIGLKLAGKLLGTPIRQNVNGTDLFPRLCGLLEENEMSLYLLGAGTGVAEAVKKWAIDHYPNLTVVGARDGFFTPEEEPGVVAEIAQSGASILMVAMGAPKQDLWIDQYRDQLGSIKVAMGVGGLFDFYSGMKPRAPQWVRELGLEWLFRLTREPKRLWKRYVVGNAVFLFRVVLSRMLASQEKETNECGSS